MLQARTGGTVLISSIPSRGGARATSLAALLTLAGALACASGTAEAQPAAPAAKPAPQPAPAATATPRHRKVHLAERTGPGYRWWCYGSTRDTQRTPQPGLLLAGGGDGYDEGMRWLEEHAHGGDMVVVRAIGDVTDDEDKRDMAPLASLQTILVTDRKAASDPFVLKRLHDAEAIFFSGGDQSRYIRYFKGTPLVREVEAAVKRGVPVGGTSAGLAILGEHCFTAKFDTVTSEEAMRNPRTARIDIEHGFLKMPYLDHVLTDTHFKKRDRMGRLLVFMAHVLAEGRSWARALAVDEGGAMVVEGDGKGKVVGKGAAWCLQASRDGLRFGRTGPCLLRDVVVQRVGIGQVFDLVRWRGPAAPYRLHLQESKVLSTRPDGSAY